MIFFSSCILLFVVVVFVVTAQKTHESGCWCRWWEGKITCLFVWIFIFIFKSSRNMLLLFLSFLLMLLFIHLWYYYVVVFFYLFIISVFIAKKQGRNFSSVGFTTFNVSCVCFWVFATTFWCCRCNNNKKWKSNNNKNIQRIRMNKFTN